MFGRASCTEPEELIAALIAYQEANDDAPSDIGCGSPLLPQPLAPTITIPRSIAARDFLDVARATVRTRTEAGLAPDADGTQAEPASATIALDADARDEEWTVAYEGILPGTRTLTARLVAGAPGALVMPGADLCRAGAREGDLLILRPDELAPGCEALVDAARPDLLTFRVTGVERERVTFAPLEGSAFAEELVAPECVTADLGAEIRAPDVFLVSGSRSGAASGLRAQDGACVADDSERGGRAQAPRVRAGEHYRGPVLDFYMYPGEVEPVRGFEYVIPVRRRFASGSSPEGRQANFAPRQNQNARGPFGTRLTDIAVARVYEDLEGGAVRERRALVAPSPTDNVVFVLQLAGRDSLIGLQ